MEAEVTKNYRCDYPGCNKAFVKPSRLQWHIRKHTGEKPYKCEFQGCTKAYTISSHLKRHFLTHDPIRVHENYFTCDICNIKVKTKQNLQRHRDRVHSDKRLFCKECGIFFRKPLKLAEHIAIHNNTIFLCNVCGKGFHTLHQMNRHRLIHERRYPCPEDNCSAAFERFHELNKHQRQCHIKLYSCDDCGKTFEKKCKLNDHIRRHQNIVYTCYKSGCHRTYTLKRNLLEHIRIRHEGQIYSCDVCKGEFCYKSSVARHIQKFH